MPKSKVGLNIDFENEAELLKVMSHPVRLRIVHGLLSRSAYVKDIWTRLDMSQSAVSQHLSILRNYGVVECVRTGTRATYSLTSPTVRRLMRVLLDSAGRPEPTQETTLN